MNKNKKYKGYNPVLTKNIDDMNKDEMVDFIMAKFRYALMNTKHSFKDGKLIVYDDNNEMII